MLRRTFLGLSTTAGLTLTGLGLVNRSKAAEDHSSTPTGYINRQVVQTRDELIHYFHGHGYSSIKPLPLVTGVDFNGGLQFDDDSSRIGPKNYVVQASARVDDVNEKTSRERCLSFT